MRKQVYISADYSESDGDKDVVDEINGEMTIITELILLTCHKWHLEVYRKNPIAVYVI